MVTPLTTPHQPTRFVDRAGRQIFYWYPESDTVDLATLEISLDNGVTWRATTLRTDPNGVEAPSLLVAGPDAALGTADVQLAASTWVVARIVDNPEVEISRGRIDVR